MLVDCGVGHQHWGWYHWLVSGFLMKKEKKGLEEEGRIAHAGIIVLGLYAVAVAIAICFLMSWSWSLVEVGTRCTDARYRDVTW